MWLKGNVIVGEHPICIRVKYEGRSVSNVIYLRKWPSWHQEFIEKIPKKIEVLYFCLVQTVRETA